MTGLRTSIAYTAGSVTTSLRNIAPLERALQTIAERELSGHCAVAVGAASTATTVALFPTEIPTANTHPRRMATYRGGRACARTALNRLGVGPVAIPVSASGAPVWPDGVVGSISHTDKVVAAVVADSPPVCGVGVDLEQDDPLDDASMVGIVCRPEELLPGFNPADRLNLQHGKLLFVVKEAVYKLYHPMTGAFLDFHDLRTTLDEAAGSFRAELVDPGLPSAAGRRAFAGRYTHVRGHIIALAAEREPV